MRRKKNLPPTDGDHASRGAEPVVSMARPRLRLGPNASIGPGKMDLLCKLRECHSISGAARECGLTYKRAWQLIHALNTGLPQPVVQAVTGGRAGGGASLTPFGEQLILLYQQLQADLDVASQPGIAALTQLIDAAGQ